MPVEMKLGRDVGKCQRQTLDLVTRSQVGIMISSVQVLIYERKCQTLVCTVLFTDFLSSNRAQCSFALYSVSSLLELDLNLELIELSLALALEYSSCGACK